MSIAAERLATIEKLADAFDATFNHPSGTRWNRHNCQLNMTDDHSACAPNGGCEGIPAGSAELENLVSARLAS
jgi:hypothetical protein